jgi:hypothetical protein
MTTANLSFDPVLLEQQELLDVHEGSLYVASNLFIQGQVYGGNVTFNSTVTSNAVITLCNDITTTIGFSLPITISNADDFLTVGAPVTMQNESVYINNLVVGDVTFSRAYAAPVFPPTAPFPAAATVLPATVTSEYDGAWTLSNVTLPPDPTRDVGALVANGKVGLVGAFDGVIGVAEAVIGVAPVFQRGTYVNNVVPTFNPFRVRMFRNDDSPDAYPALRSQALNMNTGILRSTLDVSASANAFERAGVTTEVMALRHLPFCSLMTLRIRPAMAVPYVDFFVEMEAPAALAEVDFNNNTLHNPLANNDGVYILMGDGKHTTTGNRVATALTAVADSGLQLQNLGFNAYRRTATNTCFNKFRLVPGPGTTTLSPGADHVVHLVCATMTDHDFPEPADEVRRVLMTVLSRDATPDAAIARARDAHVGQWNKVWLTTINVCARQDATAAELATTALLRRFTRATLYHIYSCTRDAALLDGTQVPLLDLNGQFMYEMDLWLTPLLTFMQPEAARALLEYRHATLAQATQLAASYGFKGAKYPASTDVMGYRAGLYWDARASLSLYNTALVAVNTWNFFRLSGDTEWLQTKGYPVLRAIAGFIVSVAVPEPTNPSAYHIEATTGIMGEESAEDNALTVNLCVLALRYCVEASYELTLPARDEWSQVAMGLAVPTALTDRELILPYKGAIPAAVVLNAVEPLHVLLPAFSTAFFGVDALRTVPRTLAVNTSTYEARVDNEYTAHPFNQGVVALMYALLAQHDADHAGKVQQFLAALQQFLASQASGAWGNLRRFGARAQAAGTHYDLGSGALFLTVLLQGLCGVVAQGGVTETRFYYEEMKIQARQTAYMPVFLRELQAVNVGPARRTIRVLNRLLRT